jgi:hypothetical protein
LSVLQWLHANGCPINQGADSESISCAAAGRGHLAVLQWARANGCEWGEETCRIAAEGGHLAVLLWLRANGCPWDESTCYAAAEGENLEVLQWARASGCPWDREAILAHLVSDGLRWGDVPAAEREADPLVIWVRAQPA